MPKSLSLARLLTAAGALALSALSCGNPCPIDLLSRRQYTAVLECCGASGSSAIQDFQVPANVELEVVNPSFASGARVDVWITRGDCDRLFDAGPYPPPGGTAPRCPAVVGPVSNGTTSARTKVAAGSYRLHLYAFSSNPDRVLSAPEVSLWGPNCSGTVF